MTKSLPLAAALALCLSTAGADEGMWTYDHFPAARVGQAYGFTPDQAWLDHLRLASVRMTGGCSGAIVSAHGLVISNHHCVRTCLDALSVTTHGNLRRDGFLARGAADEARCPGIEVSQLVAIADVTAQVQAATREVDAGAFSDVQRSAIAAIEKACASADDMRCEVVALYHGGRYALYTYRRFQDVRLVFAPEQRIAFFGGDLDNFMFPRYDLDVSLLRLYGKDGRPLEGLEHLAWSNEPLKEGELTFVSGNPAGTSRGLSLAQLDDYRDSRLPYALMRDAELRGLLVGYDLRDARRKAQADDLLFGTENALKALRGEHEALADPAFHARLADAEADFRARVMGDPALASQYGATWDAIAATVVKQQSWRKALNVLEYGPVSELFWLARRLVRYGEETPKPDGQRLREYADTRLASMRAALLAPRPVHEALEIATLTWSLTQMREQLGPDHPVVRQVFGGRSPERIAIAAVRGTRLGEMRTDAAGHVVGGYRKDLLDGGPAAIAASHDPMIALARALDPYARRVRRQVETEVDGPQRRQQELLAKAHFALYGDDSYPDATGTLRLSYGTVAGWNEGDRRIEPFTTLGGAFRHATGVDPFALPDAWLRARPRLALETPLDVAITNDTISGNSGSPVVDRDGRLVGLVFDRDTQALGSEFGFNPAVNRAVAVQSVAVIEALDKIYGARRLVEEISAGTREGAR